MSQSKQMSDIKIGVIGLGYVGLPVAVHMASRFPTIGFDINSERVHQLRRSLDVTQEVSQQELEESQAEFTSEIEQLKTCNFFIVAVPTPVDEANTPDFKALVSASRTVGKALKAGDIVVFESTVYPGATEEICLPVLLESSGLERSQINIGYSPERINPGDKEHSFTKIKKVVAADTPQALEIVANVYGAVVEAGIFKASSIKVAEAAKVIENTQRDINIALMNELTLICDRMDIDIYSVLEAAETKWNFLNFKPGLVGGHCIGVDPYYLTHKATQLGYHPEVILAGRRINDNMGAYVAQKAVKLMASNDQAIVNQDINVLGFTFKENCPDLRNTKVIDVVRELSNFGLKVNIYDPWANKEEALDEYGIRLMDYDQLPKASMTIVAVKHSQFLEMSPESFASDLIFDLKGIYRDFNGNKKIYTL
jgi:UDP-N-acetyl-D-glucosamine/UDP-N-acetyl-D-galactosamine dehydrogenase